MTTTTNLLVLQFKENGVPEGQQYYFASVAAIYEVYNRDALGIVINSLYNVLASSDVYESKKVIIKKDKVYHVSRKLTND